MSVTGDVSEQHANVGLPRSEPGQIVGIDGAARFKDEVVTIDRETMPSPLDGERGLDRGDRHDEPVT